MHSRFNCVWVTVCIGIAGAGWSAADTQNLLVGSWGTHSIRLYDGSTGAFIEDFVAPGSGGLSTPDGMDFGHDGNLYVSSSDTNAILRFDGQTGDLIGVFSTERLSAPGNLQFGPDGLLYVCNKANGEVLRFDTASGALVDVFASGGGLAQPVGMAWLNDLLYVADFSGGAIRRYDATTGAFVDNFDSIPSPLILNTDADGNLFASSCNLARVRRYDAISGARSNMTRGGPIACPVGHVVLDNGERIVASWGNHQLLRYDALTGDYLGVLAIGDGLLSPNDLLLTTVPEPGTALLMLVCVAWAGAARRR